MQGSGGGQVDFAGASRLFQEWIIHWTHTLDTRDRRLRVSYSGNQSIIVPQTANYWIILNSRSLARRSPVGVALQVWRRCVYHKWRGGEPYYLQLQPTATPINASPLFAQPVPPPSHPSLPLPCHLIPSAPPTKSSITPRHTL